MHGRWNRLRDVAGDAVIPGTKLLAESSIRFGPIEADQYRTQNSRNGCWVVGTEGGSGSILRKHQSKVGKVVGVQFLDLVGDFGDHPDTVPDHQFSQFHPVD